jgi:predicted nucleic acid-binding protein
MILADTSVWIDFFRHGDPEFAARVARRQVACHAIVLGELACGQLPQRAQTLKDLRALHYLEPVSDAEVHHLLEQRQLFGTGLGWADLHLLASALVAGVPLETRDRRLAAAARRVGAGLLSVAS